MNDAQELIAAALRLAALAERNTDDRDEWHHAIDSLREACARAMVATPVKTCSDERPCTPCFTDNGPCEGPSRAMVQPAAPDGWQPIETAPKDGSSVLLATALSYADGYWLQSAYDGNGAWIWPYAFKEPRYWMPLQRVPK
jgi:hypothetical protein